MYFVFPFCLSLLFKILKTEGSFRLRDSQARLHSNWTRNPVIAGFPVPVAEAVKHWRPFPSITRVCLLDNRVRLILVHLFLKFLSTDEFILLREMLWYSVFLSISVLIDCLGNFSDRTLFFPFWIEKSTYGWQKSSLFAKEVICLHCL